MAEGTKSRRRLSRERILRAALQLADAHGVEALTMRGLSRKLGCEAMSLYNHVANKDDLLEGLLDLVLAETEPPSPDEPWKAAVRQSALSVHRTLRRHPWACGLLLSPARIRPARLRYMDSLLGHLRDAGFPAETTYHAYHVLDGHIFGFALWANGHGFVPGEAEELVARLERAIPFEQYPHLHEHGRQHVADGPHQDVSAFELGLDFILDGLETILAR